MTFARFPPPPPPPGGVFIGKQQLGMGKPRHREPPIVKTLCNRVWRLSLETAIIHQPRTIRGQAVQPSVYLPHTLHSSRTDKRINKSPADLPYRAQPRLPPHCPPS